MAEAAGASLVVDAPGGPTRAAIDTRAIEPGDLFVGLVGERVDGGRFAADALAAGAWGVLVTPEHAAGLERRRGARRRRSARWRCSGSRRPGGVRWTPR